MSKKAATGGKTPLWVIPLKLNLANELVTNIHRHHKKVVAHRFSLGVIDHKGKLRGVAIIGNPMARLEDRRIVEVVRVATDGCPNACSALYGAARQSAKAMGFAGIITFTLATEPGTSLRAAGFIEIGRYKGGSWHRTTGGRTASIDPSYPTDEKIKWGCNFSAPPNWPQELQ